MQKLLREVELIQKSNTKTIEQIGLKMSEEVGECSQALLSYVNSQGSEYKELGVEDVKEECIDVILVALSLFYKLEGTTEDIETILGEKITKWKSKSSIVIEEDTICKLYKIYNAYDLTWHGIDIEILYKEEVVELLEVINTQELVVMYMRRRVLVDIRDILIRKKVIRD